MNLPPPYMSAVRQLGCGVPLSLPAPVTSLLSRDVLQSISGAQEVALKSRMGNNLLLTAWRDCLIPLHQCGWGSQDKRFDGSESVL